MKVEVMAAALLLSAYATIFGASLYARFGGGGLPDLLDLRREVTLEQSPQETPVSEVLGARSTPEATPPEPTATPRPPAPSSATVTPWAEPPAVATARPEPAGSLPATAGARVRSLTGVHVVRRGDTLSDLALLYGVSVEQIALVNGLTTTLIFEGQQLRVPVVPSREITVANLGGN
jgi:nucleoid-associated protein YgaU